MGKFFVALAVFLLAGTGIGAAQCSMGQRLLLVSDAYNHDVLVWDARQRLLDYEAGDWKIKQVLLSHALLARAGTSAIVTACQPNIVHPKYRLVPADAAGIKLISGPYKGRYGWLMADDLHALTRAK